VITWAILAGGGQKRGPQPNVVCSWARRASSSCRTTGGSIGELFAGRDLHGFHVNLGFGRAGRLAVTMSTLSLGIASSACRRRCSLGQLVGDRIGQLGP
jgi:hypothetical protein